MAQKYWYHGTNRDNAKAIIECGYFDAGTWFARHLEDALAYGGEYVFMVQQQFKSLNGNRVSWQTCCSTVVPTSCVANIAHYMRTTLPLKSWKLPS